MRIFGIALSVAAFVVIFNSCELNTRIVADESDQNDNNIPQTDNTPAPDRPLPPSDEVDPITLDKLNYVVKSHPRLVTAEELANQKELLTGTPEALDNYLHLKEVADAVIDSGQFETIDNPDSIPFWRRGDQIAQRIKNSVDILSVLYLIEKDKKYLDRLWLELELFCSFENWNDKVFLDTVMVTNAVTYAYDILYDDWTPQQRKTINGALIRNTLRSAIKFYLNTGQGVPWAYVDHNWNALANSAVVKTLIAFDDTFDEIDENKMFKDSIISNRRFIGVHYAPSGASAEGPTYWSSGISNEITYLKYLKLALGSTFELLKSPGFAEAGYYAIYIQSPIGKLFNYSDTAYRLGDGFDLFGDRFPPYTQNVMFNLGDYFKNPYFIDFARNFPYPNSGSYQVVDEMKKVVPPPDYSKLPLSRRLKGLEIDVVTMRSAWNDPNALFAGIKAGKGNSSHSQLDQGTILIHDLGEQWLVDLGNDNYSLPKYFHTSLSASPNRYHYYTNRTEAHNCVVVNFDNSIYQQHPSAQTAVIRHEDGGITKTTFAVSDLTSAYTLTSNALGTKNRLKKYLRGLAMIDRKWILLQDEIYTGSATGLNGWWLMHTLADITILGSNGQPAQLGSIARLDQNAKSYYLKILGPSHLRFETALAKPLNLSPSPPGQMDAVARGVKRLTIKLTNFTGVTIRVAFTSDLNFIPSSANIKIDIQNWTNELYDSE